MVAPLIVGAGRVVGGTGKVAARGTQRRKGAGRGTSRSKLQDTRRRGVYRSREERNEENEPEQFRQRTDFVQKALRINEKRRALKGKERVKIDGEEEGGEGSSLLQTAHKEKAAIVGENILMMVLPFYTVQLLFWLLGLGGLGLELAPVANLILPGTELFILAYFVIGIVGLGSMLAAMILFKRRFINCFGGYKKLIFLACLTGYFTFFLNFIPFVALWVLSVMFMQSKEGAGEGEG